MNICAMIFLPSNCSIDLCMINYGIYFFFFSSENLTNDICENIEPNGKLNRNFYCNFMFSFSLDWIFFILITVQTFCQRKTFPYTVSSIETAKRRKSNTLSKYICVNLQHMWLKLCAAKPFSSYKLENL